MIIVWSLHTINKDVVNAYLKAVRKGTFDGKLSTAELKQLVNMICDYTRKLAKVNDVKVERFKQHSLNSIDNLQAYLEVQKRIFQEAA